MITNQPLRQSGLSVIIETVYKPVLPAELRIPQTASFKYKVNIAL